MFKVIIGLRSVGRISGSLIPRLHPHEVLREISSVNILFCSLGMEASKSTVKEGVRVGQADLQAQWQSC